jgi:CBS domain-containing protein
MDLPSHPRVLERPVRTLLNGKAPCAPSVVVDATVQDALRVMAEQDVGAVAVMGKSGLVGVFSERDYARMKDGGAAAATPVRQVMAPCEVFVTPAHTIRQCLQLLSGSASRFLPVLDSGRPIAVLSADDLLTAGILHCERVFHELKIDWKLLFLRGTYSC